MGNRATPNAWPDREDMVRLIGEHNGVVASIARATGFPRGSVQNHIASNTDLSAALAAARGGSSPAVDVCRDRHVTSSDPAEWGDVESLLRRRGLNLEDWIVTRARVNEWGDPAALNTQLRVDVAPRIGLLMPARADGWKAPKARPRKASGSELVAFFGDHHAPHHDEQLHAAVVEWLRDHQPDRAVILGDLLDFDQVSRHRRTPEWTAGMQETIDAGYAILRAYVGASPNTRWQLLLGNHEDRMRNAILDQLSALHGLTRAGDEEEHPVLSVPFLLRLDELGIEACDPGGGYEHGQINVTSELAARHGWIASKGSGSSALKTIEHLRYSCVIGHTHRQSQVFKTAHSINGEPRTLTGVEAGTLAKVQGGLGYAIAPDWANGFATARVYDDGTFKVDLATYVDRALMWGDWRCKA